MLVVRPAEIDDLDPLFDLIQLSELGLSTLKISRDRLAERIEESVRAFSKKTARPNGQPYVFILEDLARHAIVGTSAIYSKVGGFQPFYSYEIRMESKRSGTIGVAREIPYLNLHTTHDGPTEIGSLFLHPDYWGSGHGRLLSLSRFLFVAEFPERFEKETIAEMRGVVRPDGWSPLWNALGSHFFQIEYPRAETLTLESKKLIAELMPQHPIYIPLLPREAQEVIGKVHEKTEPALRMLEEEGFVITNFVDIFDGGPTVQCRTDQIRSVRDSRIATVTELLDHVEGKPMLVSSRQLEFRCVSGPVKELPDGSVAIDNLAALQLELKLGDSIRYVAARSNSQRRARRDSSQTDSRQTAMAPSGGQSGTSVPDPSVPLSKPAP
jgi:arginine N-succinyltransferase